MMVKVDICIGSACYVKGSSKLVGLLNELISSENWQNEVTVKGSFCMQSCQNHLGLGVKINDEVIKGLTLSNAKEILKEEINKRL